MYCFGHITVLCYDRITFLVCHVVASENAVGMLRGIPVQQHVGHAKAFQSKVSQFARDWIKEKGSGQI